MKIIGSFLTLFFSTLGLAFAQEKIDSLIHSRQDTLKNQWKSIPDLKVDSIDTGRILLDSGFLFLPKSLNPERYMDLLPNRKFRIGMPPIYQLPDPQSRMPIKEFDDSVNYTIQIKKID
ncbi:hypothetical protein [Algoriphagus formosus]|uniref:Uncharacterized protein n=1 Tax=Algoriphagus formosus TaxID=2007308 RepID=A0A4R5V043_9BACT|nr:hypothetical protein [Algoriphagus aquimaris]TDK44881.1 hypothetical protein E1898_09925 [Algoriphagus aquimaris]